MAINDNNYQIAFFAAIVTIKYDSISAADFSEMVSIITQAIAGVGIYDGDSHNLTNGDVHLYYVSPTNQVHDIIALAQIIYPIVKEHCHGKLEISLDNTGNQVFEAEF